MANNILKSITGASGAAFTLRPATGQSLQLMDDGATARLSIAATTGLITINGPVVPNATGTRDFGSTSLRWGAFYGVNLGMSGNGTFSGDLEVTGGDLTSSATTFNLLNATPTTINFGGAGTTINIGAATGTTTVANSLKAKDFRLSALNTAPASAGATGTLGEIRIDASNIYVCTASNTWKRVAIATF